MPFTPTPVSRTSVPGAAPTKQCQVPDETATVNIPAAKLTAAELAALQAVTSAMVTLTVPASTLLGVLKRTDILSAPAAPTAALTASDTHPEPASPPDASPDKAAPTAMVATTVVPPTEQAFDTRAYKTQKGGLYTIQKGMTLEHRGHTIAAGKTLFDTCSEVNLLSKEDADANHILYGPCPTTIHTSMGSAGGVMGQVVGPVFCVLNKGTLHECKTATQEGVNSW